MKFLILVLSVGAALGRPSGYGPLLKFADDGRSFSYSYQTPAVLHATHAVQPVARFVQPVHRFVQHVQPAPVIVGPAVNYYGTSFGAVRNYEPANIQVSSDGFVLDTPEVANARREHLALVAQQAANAGVSGEEVKEENYNSIDEDTVEVKAANIAPGPPQEPAIIQVSADGHVLDTPEVAKARIEFLARFAEEAALAAAHPEQPEDIQVNNNLEYRFAQPIHVYAPAPVIAPAVKSYEIANIQLSADGHVLDTPEVAQAKAEHFARFAQESSRATVNNHFVNNAYRFAQPINVIDPVAVPAVRAFEVADIKLSADGHVIDTPEVAQAKSAHFAQYAADAARAEAAGGDQSDLSDTASAHADSLSAISVRTGINKFDDAPADIKVSSDGFVLDTPEVAQAKSVHLAKLAAAGESYDDGSSSHGAAIVAAAPTLISYTSPSIAYTATPVGYAQHYQAKWTGPEADIKVGSDGFLIDTPEVQQARAEHLSTRSAALAGKSSVWTGAVAQYAQIPAAQYLQDTPEVAAARAAHLAEYAKTASRSSGKTYNYGQLVYNAPYVRTAVPFSYSYSHPGYNLLSYRYAPVALTPDGQFLLDTPEVAAAKADHFAAHAKALHH